jgi:dTDP-4-dehydrorhamnose reductase
MRILLLGKNGQVGWYLTNKLLPLGEVFAFGADDLDFRDDHKLRQTIIALRPQIVVNAAAYTAVDRAESEPDLVMQINRDAPGAISEAVRSIDAVLIHYSTDYVFDGKKKIPYREEDATFPVNSYGLSKMAGEQAIQKAGCVHLILRTSWVYSQRRENFLKKVLNWSRQEATIRAATDQIGSPSWAGMLAEMTVQIISKCKVNPVDYFYKFQGIYHLAGEGIVSRYDWARAILKYDPAKEDQKSKEILPALAADFPTLAKRPPFSALDCRKIQTVLDIKLRDWESYLQEALRQPLSS